MLKPMKSSDSVTNRPELSGAAEDDSDVALRDGSYNKEATVDNQGESSMEVDKQSTRFQQHESDQVSQLHDKVVKELTLEVQDKDTKDCSGEGISASPSLPDSDVIQRNTLPGLIEGCQVNSKEDSPGPSSLPPNEDDNIRPHSMDHGEISIDMPEHMVVSADMKQTGGDITEVNESGAGEDTKQTGGDITEVNESGGGAADTMLENPQLRWSFVRKVYSIIAFQLLLTIAVASVGNFVHPVAYRLKYTTRLFDLIVNVVLFLIPLIALYPLSRYRKKYPLNYFFLFIFMLSSALGLGLTCGFEKRKVILEALILTAGVVFTLILYTFWAARRGHDFRFLGPFLFEALLVLILFALIQILFPLGKWSLMIYGGLGAIIFCAYIIYDTGRLIKRCSCDDYIWASVCLYLDIIGLFTSFLNALKSALNATPSPHLP